MKSGEIITPHKETIELVNKLNKSTEYYLTTILRQLIEKRGFEEIKDAEWPLLTIIKDVFSNDHIDNHTKLDFDKIVDVYSYTAPTTYSLSSYKHFPNYIKTRKQYINGKIKDADPIEEKNREYLRKRRMLYETKTLKNYQTINIIVMRHLEKNI
jgi:hypothetical protein